MLALVANDKADPKHYFVRGEWDDRFKVLVSEDLSNQKRLSDWMRVDAARASPELKLKIKNQFEEILSILAHGHIVHGDLNPNNFFIDLEGNLRVFDLGIAAKVGTKPESLNGKRSGASLYISENQRQNWLAQVQDDRFTLNKLIHFLGLDLP